LPREKKTESPSKILVIGATGFIGRHIAGHLIAQGCEVTLGVRDVEAARRRFPMATILGCDLARDSEAIWVKRLVGIDAVVNAAGLLDSSEAGSLHDVHVEGPKRLFNACLLADCRRIVHLSAISANDDVGTQYATSKLEGEQVLQASTLDWTILRPSLVYGPGSYGGTSLMRGLAGFPMVTPIPGSGEFAFQPIHIDDLSALVSECLTDDVGTRLVLQPVGPQIRSLEQIVLDMRRWLDLPDQPVVHIPMALIKFIAGLMGTFFPGPVSPTAIRQMEYGNTGDYQAYLADGGRPTRSMSRALAQMPSTVQDRWHAKLYFLRPGLRFALFFLWFASGLVGLLWGQEQVEAIGRALRWEGHEQILLIGFCAMDVVLALGLLIRGHVTTVLTVQFLAVLGYTLSLGILVPELWTDLYGGLIKNIPILAAILALLAIEHDK